MNINYFLNSDNDFGPEEAQHIGAAITSLKDSKITALNMDLW